MSSISKGSGFREGQSIIVQTSVLRSEEEISTQTRDEDCYGPTPEPGQVWQPPFPQLGLRRQGGLFVGADVSDDRLHEDAEHDAFLSTARFLATKIFRSPSRSRRTRRSGVVMPRPVGPQAGGLPSWPKSGNF